MGMELSLKSGMYEPLGARFLMVLLWYCSRFCGEVLRFPQSRTAPYQDQLVPTDAGILD